MMTRSWPALVSCHNKRGKASCVGQDDDRLGELPDEILLSIISSFTIKEAARLRLVSRRCEFIWRCFPLLIFEDSRAMGNIWGDWKEIAKERTRFVGWVDHVLEEHLGAFIDELRITFDLDSNSQSHVDKWVAFALDKQVKRLELDFSSCWRNCFRMCKGVRTPMCGEPLDMHPRFTSNNSSITSLSLKYVNITNEFIDCLSHTFPLLEKLCIVGSRCLTRVSGSLKQVKHLEVSECFNLKTIDISAPKLHSFINYGQPIELHIAHASSLTEVSIGWQQSKYRIAYAFDSLSEYFSQLVYLNLRISLLGQMSLRMDNALEMDNPPAMPNLQHLELQVAARVDQNLRGWSSLIAASPRLHKLSLKLSGHHIHTPGWPIRKWAGFPLKCLNTFELVGYVGRAIDLELAFFVFDNAPMLQEVSVDFVPWNWPKLNKSDVRDRLVLLQMKLPEGVKLIVK